MAAARPDRNARVWRELALLAAALVPGTMDAGRWLAMGTPLDASSMALTTADTLVLLAILAFTFDLAMARRLTGAWLFLLTGLVAVGTSIAEGFALWGLADALDGGFLMPAHRTVGFVVRAGIAGGILGLGLFAMAVLLPFAASGAREAQRLRAAAELANLRANLQPHFLFNTLSTVSGLVGEDPREARRLIGALGDLLRDSLVEGGEMQTLDAEIAWLKNYAGILETRHRGSISFRWEIEEATRGVLMPRLLLQPLIENAVKHGALCRPEGGEVILRTTLSQAPGARITCTVEDNGPGPAAGVTRPGALGVDLVTRRLALKYGRTAEFRLERRAGRTQSIVEFPAGQTS